MFLIDTNIFLRSIVNTEKKAHIECSNFLKLVQLNKVKASTTSVVLSEIAWTMKSFYKIPKSEICIALKSILTLGNLSICDDYDHELAIDYYLNNKIKYIDAQIASVLINSNKFKSIVSYDKEFDKIDVIRKEPNEILKLFK